MVFIQMVLLERENNTTKGGSDHCGKEVRR